MSSIDVTELSGSHCCKHLQIRSSEFHRPLRSHCWPTLCRPLDVAELRSWGTSFFSFHFVIRRKTCKAQRKYIYLSTSESVQNWNTMLWQELVHKPENGNIVFSPVSHSEALERRRSKSPHWQAEWVIPVSSAFWCHTLLTVSSCQDSFSPVVDLKPSSWNLNPTQIIWHYPCDGMPSLRMSVCSDCHTNKPRSLALWSECMFGTL